jgi:hypothetical protein
MFLAIPVLIIATILIYSAGASSKQNEIEELKGRIEELEGKLEETLGDDWEDNEQPFDI